MWMTSELDFEDGLKIGEYTPFGEVFDTQQEVLRTGC